ncbi:hypothetical protein AAVH_33708 [Aphelenchoides avenae]|nr:hypothetical protein AAVH_33708 [Aphelenchus avenae]
MCAVHAIRRVDVHSTKIPAHLRKRMREEVLLLQGARNDVELERIAGMLLEVWRGKEDVFASSESSFAYVGELFEAYRISFVDGPVTWEEHAERRFEAFFGVHLVYPSTKFNGRFYECSCQKGCKKNVCKHAVMVICTLEKT